MPVTGDRSGRRFREGASDAEPAEPPWHEKTSTLLAASLAAVVVLALVYFLVSTMVREFDDPQPVQQYFLDPTTSGTERPSGSTTTTTQTITSTSPPITSDINPGDTTTSSTDTSTSTSTRRPSIGRDDDDDGPSTTRSRPRLNETRTLYPRP